ncbi:MAG: 16S rRNA (cytidine(1402)-2'-O)-methyltransferase, partial [Nitrospirota bacterium]
AGVLYIVSTPIGNPDDITLRALRILREVAIVAAEDTQSTSALFAHHAIDTPLTSYHNLNKEDKTPVLLRRLEDGQSVALVSDAGTPVISDPGSFLITQALAAGIRVMPVPGPSAILAALSASGLVGDTFLFLGYLPGRTGLRRRLLARLCGEYRTLILFEYPNRLRATVTDIRSVLGNRRIVLAEDLTTSCEEFVRGTAEEVLRSVASRPHRGEITLVVEGNRHRKRSGATRGVRSATRQRASGS